VLRFLLGGLRASFEERVAVHPDRRRGTCSSIRMIGRCLQLHFWLLIGRLLLRGPFSPKDLLHDVDRLDSEDGEECDNEKDEESGRHRICGLVEICGAHLEDDMAGEADEEEVGERDQLEAVISLSLIWRQVQNGGKVHENERHGRGHLSQVGDEGDHAADDEFEEGVEHVEPPVLCLVGEIEKPELQLDAKLCAAPVDHHRNDHQESHRIDGDEYDIGGQPGIPVSIEALESKVGGEVLATVNLTAHG